MAQVPTFVRVGYKDAPGRINEVRYRLRDGLEDDGVNIADVIADVAALEVQLGILTMDHIEYVYLEADLATANAAANIAANNQVYAMLRCQNANTEKPVAIQVPAWDDILFAQDTNGLITTPAFASAADAAVALLADPETGDPLTYQWAQSRGRKLRKKQLG